MQVTPLIPATQALGRPPGRRRLLGAGLCLGLAPWAALAQEHYPARQITIVVPFPPGGSVDAMVRQYADPLSAILGVPIVVENRPGAGGSVGALHVARARPDGYTLVASSQSSHLANPLTQPRIGYDPVKDFENIALLGRLPNVLVVHPSVPARSFGEFVAYVKAHPGQLHYGSSGTGSMSQLDTEIFKADAGLDIVHVPYRGGSQLMTALLGGEVQVFLSNLISMLPYIPPGKVRALAVASERRVAQLPDLPTLAEVGHPQINLSSWTGLSAPAGTPPAIVQTLHRAIRQAATAPAMAASLQERGVFVPEEMSPAAFEQMMSERLARYGAVVRRIGIVAD
ncbi:Bug family tripartite tricarboxylate transporter substrate binding protein [Delftia sp. PS-11]|uniref:Bug family tripartite tricarboxylate transporter substrate binding protein n=1 Tax=Delftia sp. PS-11 TaxID=2767222 RepID=UPI0024565614|nr:tripartite tricarboxylate transporter substrate binding protein [Delftia sp. PS-11]KAJ8746019.1 tripartite tricarboxylate transporter substrate binding protein [Delftia sp. PS-11]